MDLGDWIGRSEEASDVVTPAPCAALAATLDLPADLPKPGTPLPPLWHWLYFLPRHRRSELGPDGHARRGFLPPVPLPRRMWAGSRFEFHRPLHIGDSLMRRSTIERITEKTGRSGALVFVTLRHEIARHDEAACALREWHDIVYREAPRVGEALAPPQRAPEDARWQRRWEPDDVLLFRYSALTFNGHRIHYDRRYATEVEGYPGLVVHGPLIATLLLDLLRRHAPGRQPARFEFRALRPLFDGHPFTVCGQAQADGRSVRLWAADHQGWLTMDATATLR
jgi:3-methylfumaryl-CoA hydratase